MGDAAPSDRRPRVSVSVVIATLNRPALLDRCLARLPGKRCRGAV